MSPEETMLVYPPFHESRRSRPPRPATPSPAAAPRRALWQLPLPLGTRVDRGQFQDFDELGRPRVSLLGALGAVVSAEWALPYRYVPIAGDLLLLIGRGESQYVIGVVRGKGCSQLAFLGDACVQARGSMRLRADRELRLVGGRVTLRGRLLELVAETLVFKVERSWRQVRSLLSERAGRVQRLVKGDDFSCAGRRSILAKCVVRIGGKVLKIG